MNQYLVVIQDPKGYPTEPILIEKAPTPREPQIHTALLVHDVKVYLDEAITIWRAKRDFATNSGELEMAIHYIDAFQSARVSILGEALP